MRSRLILSVFLSSLSVLPAMAAAQHNVSWYIAHRDELNTTLSSCQDDPGDLAKAPDCTNAQAAQHEIILSNL